MARRPEDLLAWAVALVVAALGVAMMLGHFARGADPTLRFTFGGVLVLYALYRVAAQSTRSNRRDDG